MRALEKEMDTVQKWTELSAPLNSEPNEDDEDEEEEDDEFEDEDDEFEEEEEEEEATTAAQPGSQFPPEIIQK